MNRPDDWTIIELLQWTTTYFETHGIDSPRLDAELLLACALGLERIDLYLRHDQPLNSEELDRFRELVKRRKAREPIAYITGQKEFWALELAVGPGVLIPRPETECVVEAVLDFMATRTGSGAHRILDLGTGSGAIALAIAHSRPETQVVAVERSRAALAFANRNCRRHALGERVQIVAGRWFDIFSAGQARFDVIVSNPPYIPSHQVDTLQPEIARYEPREALDGGVEGLDCLKQIIGQASSFLAHGGALFLEIGHDQYPAVRRIAESCRVYRDITCRPDYSGLDRVASFIKG